MSWTSARDHCRNKGGRLVSLETQQKYDEIIEIYQGETVNPSVPKIASHLNEPALFNSLRILARYEAKSVKTEHEELCLNVATEVLCDTNFVSDFL